MSNHNYAEEINQVFQDTCRPFLYEPNTLETRDCIHDSLKSALQLLFNNPDTKFVQGIGFELVEPASGTISLQIPASCVELAEALVGVPIEQQILEAEINGDEARADFLRSLPYADMRPEAAADRLEARMKALEPSV